MSRRLRLLSGLDAGFLYLESPETPMHVGSLMLLERPQRRGYEFHRALLKHVGARLPRAPALRRVLQHAPLELAHPMWRTLDTIDVEAHIATRRLRAPGSHRQLMSLVATLHAGPLPRDRPLWQFVVIEGLASGELALYSKIHHALLDGQGGMALAQALLDVDATASHDPKAKSPATTPDSTKDPQPSPRRRDVAQVAARGTLNQFARLVRAMPGTLRMATAAIGDPRTLAGRLRDAVLLAPRTPFNVQVCAQRRFAVASIPLHRAKHAARAFGVSLNDVVLAMCAGALRAQLGRLGTLPKQTLIAAMPVSLREAGSTESNNQVSMVQCPLATDIEDPVERLLAINAASSGIKQRVSAFRSLIPTDFPGLAAPLWASGLSRLWARGRVAEKLPPLANLAISNVPGPAIDLYLAGARLSHYYPISIVTHGLGLNITVQSYAGNLEFGVIACRDVEPNPEAIARALTPALDELVAQIPA